MPSHDREIPKQFPAHRSRHQITRSITELSGPIRLHRHHPHHQNHVGDRDVPLSAAPALQSRASIDGVASVGGTPNMSPNPSRRPSIRGSEDVVAPVDPSGRSMKRISKEAELNAEREKAVARTTGLKKSILNLGSFSTATTRQLDLTYSSVVEKLNFLQGTIADLKDLASMSKEMNEGFASESEELIHDVQSQLDAFGNFENQKKRVQTLQERIDGGRQKMQVLGERVDVVRGRIEGWERADKEWQERTRKRLKVIWWITSIIFFVFVLLFISAQYVPDGLEEKTVRLANETINKIRNGTLLSSDHSPEQDDDTANRLQGLLNRTRPVPTAEEERLRAFDEL